MNQRQPLQTYVRRTLLRRLALVAVAVAVVFAAGTWSRVRGRVEDQAVRIAEDRLGMIRGVYVGMLDDGAARDEAVAAAVAAVAAMDRERGAGRFCYAVFYDREGDFHVYRDSTQGLDAAAAALIGDDRSARPAADKADGRLVRIDGRRAVRVVLPVADAAIEAWAAGVFLLPPEISGALVSEPLRTAAQILFVVLATAALLYPVILRLAGRLAVLSADLLEANLEMMEVLGCAVARRDSDTDAHNYRVTIYAVRLAEHVGLTTGEIQSLIKGAFLHDVGKIGIGDDVLLKPGKLDEAEFAIMQGHVEHGMDIVCRATWLQDALAVVASHHEKYDGAGYPQNIPGEEIPAGARIFAIVDVFDTLTSARPYKDPLPLWRVMEVLAEGRGTHFDPAMLDCFMEIAPELFVELSEYSAGQLRGAVQAINERYFAAAPEAVLV